MIRMNSMVALVVVGLVGAFGCGDSGSSGGGNGGSNSGGDGGGGSSPTSSSGSAGSTGSAGGDVCGPAGIDMNDACEVCAGTKCTESALACCEKPGCLDIVRCVQDTECDPDMQAGPPGCYNLGDPANPGLCQDEMDTAGVVVALGEASTFGDCVIANCSAECGIMAGTGGAGGGM